MFFLPSRYRCKDNTYLIAISNHPEIQRKEVQPCRASAYPSLAICVNDGSEHTFHQGCYNQEHQIV
jgi:hypothetical protein